jgi:hypothetical protein
MVQNLVLIFSPSQRKCTSRKNPTPIARYTSAKIYHGPLFACRGVWPARGGFGVGTFQKTRQAFPAVGSSLSVALGLRSEGGSAELCCLRLDAVTWTLAIKQTSKVNAWRDTVRQTALSRESLVPWTGAGGCSSLAMLDPDGDANGAQTAMTPQAECASHPSPYFAQRASADWLPAHVSQLPVHSSPGCSRALCSSLFALFSIALPTSAISSSLHTCDTSAPTCAPIDPTLCSSRRHLPLALHITSSCPNLRLHLLATQYD